MRWTDCSAKSDDGALADIDHGNYAKAPLADFPPTLFWWHCANPRQQRWGRPWRDMAREGERACSSVCKTTPSSVTSYRFSLVLQLLKVVIPLVGPAQNGRFVSAVLSRGNLFPI